MTARACTIVSVSYLAQARVLARSFLENHPDGEFVVLITDDPAGKLIDDAHEQFRVVRPDWLDLERSEFLVMAAIYDAAELATALKPWLMQRLLEESGGPLLYFDSDIEIFAPLYDLLELSDRRSLTVTPHLLTPLPRDGLRPDGADILVAGVYNAGFVGAGAGALSSRFFEFWSDQLARDAVLDPNGKLFADQRWLDLIGCFDHAVVREPAFNLAYWNAWGCTLARDGDRVLVDGRPLRFFHFSGFNPREPHQLSRYQNRIELDDAPVLAWLCEHWATALLESGLDDWDRLPYGWSRSGDLALDRTARRVYREAVLTADEDGRERPPSPFGEDGGSGFLAWLTEPLEPVGCSRYLRGFRDRRPDLCFTFPDPDGADGRRLVHMAAFDDTFRTELAPQCFPRISHAGGVDSRPLPGINIAAPLDGASGPGRAARLVAKAAAAAGLPFATRSVTSSDSASGPALLPEGDTGWPFDLNVVCVDADSAPGIRRALGAGALRNRRTVLICDREPPRFDSSLPEAWKWVDEVWVSNRLTETGRTESLQVFPFPIPARREPAHLTRDDLGLPSDFLVLSTVDLRGEEARGSAAAMIAAYKRAFERPGGACLVLEIINAGSDRQGLQKLRLDASRPDVVFREQRLSPLEHEGVMAQADCYASLERPAGFVSRLAEAMALGKPTVTADSSCNLEFVDEETSLLVPTGDRSEPDVAVAAAHLRWIFENPSGAAALGARAGERVAATRTFEHAGRFLLDAFERLHAVVPPR